MLSTAHSAHNGALMLSALFALAGLHQMMAAGVTRIIEEVLTIPGLAPSAGHANEGWDSLAEELSEETATDWFRVATLLQASQHQSTSDSPILGQLQLLPRLCFAYLSCFLS
jgi:hypothetical protein